MLYNKYSLLTYLLTSAVSSLMMLWWLMKGCMGQRFATSVNNTVVWIAELVHVKKSWKLVEISLTTLF